MSPQPVRPATLGGAAAATDDSSSNRDVAARYKSWAGGGKSKRGGGAHAVARASKLYWSTASSFCIRHHVPILVSVVCAMTIIIIALSATHRRDADPAAAKTTSSSNGGVSASDRDAARKRYRTYHLTGNEGPEYSLRIELADVPYESALNSVSSERYLKLVYDLENSMNELLSSTLSSVSRGGWRSGGVGTGRSFCRLTFLQNSSMGTVEANYKIFANIYKIIIEEGTSPEAAIESKMKEVERSTRKDGKNKDSSQHIIDALTFQNVQNMQSFLIDLLISNSYQLGSFKVTSESIIVTLYQEGDFHVVSVVGDEDADCGNIEKMLQETTNECLEVFRWLRPGSRINPSRLLCSYIQASEHCIVEEIRPYRCSARTIHEGIFEKLREGNYIADDFECDDACTSPSALFDYVFPAHCPEEYARNVEAAASSSAVDSAEEDEDVDRCQRMSDLVNCGKRTLFKQGFCDASRVEQTFREARELFIARLNVDPLDCSKEQCAGGKAEEMVMKALRGEKCEHFIYTLDYERNNNLDNASFCQSFNGLLRCVKDEVESLSKNRPPCTLPEIESVFATLNDWNSANGDNLLLDTLRIDYGRWVESASQCSQLLGYYDEGVVMSGHTSTCDIGNALSLDGHDDDNNAASAAATGDGHEEGVCNGIAGRVVGSRFIDTKCRHFEQLVRCVQENSHAMPEESAHSSQQQQQQQQHTGGGEDESDGGSKTNQRSSGMSNNINNKCPYSQTIELSKEFLAWKNDFDASLCEYDLGAGFRSMDDILTRGPLTVGGILSEVESAKLNHLTYFSMYEREVFFLQIWSKYKEGFRLRSSTRILPTHRGLNTVDLGELHLAKGVHDIVGLQFVSKIIPLPHSTSSPGESNAGAQNYPMRGGSRLMLLDSNSPSKEFALGTYREFKSIGYGDDDDSVLNFAFKLDVVAFTNQNDGNNNNFEESSQSRSSKRDQSNTDDSKMNSNDGDGKGEENRDFFMLLRSENTTTSDSEGALQETKCDPLAVPQFSSFENVILPSTVFCNLNSILNDKVVSYCAANSGYCNLNSENSSAEDYCRGYFEFMGCASDVILQSGSALCDNRLLADVKVLLRDFASNALAYPSDLAVCYDSDEPLLFIQSMPASCKDPALLTQLLNQKCAFVPLVNYESDASKCRAIHVSAVCLQHNLVKMGYIDCLIDDVWMGLNDLAIQTSSQFLSVPSTDFSMQICGSAAQAMDGSVFKQPAELKLCAPLSDIEEKLKGPCSLFTDDGYDCNFYTSTVRCVTSSLAAEGHQCDYDSIDYLFRENKFFFIENLNGLDPERCLQDANTTDDDATSTDNNLSRCNQDVFQETFWQYCEPPEVQFGMELTISERCDFVENTIQCIMQNSQCTHDEVALLSLQYVDYFRDVHAIDPMLCTLAVTLGNYHHAAEQHESDCANSLSTWSAAQKANLPVDPLWTLIQPENSDQDMNYVYVACQMVRDASRFIQMESLDNDGLFCPLAALRERLFAAFVPVTGFLGNEEMCMHADDFMRNSERISCPSEISEYEVRRSNCVIALEEEDISDCSAVTKFTYCLMNYINDFNGHKCPEVNILALAKKTNGDFLVQQSIGNTKACLLFKEFDNLLISNESGSGSLSEEKCRDFYSGQEIVDTGCLGILLHGNAPDCSSVGEFFNCFAHILSMNGEYCPKERLVSNLLNTQYELLHVESNAFNQICLEEAKIQMIQSSPSCLNYYPESHFEDSGCNSIFQQANSSVEDCNIWTEFFECFSSYYNTNIGMCDAESIAMTLIRSQYSYLDFISDGKYDLCIEELNLLIGDVPQTNCLDTYPETMIQESYCKVFLEQDSTNCQLIEQFFECFTDFYEDNYAECSFENIAGAMLENQLEYLYMSTNPSLKYCYSNPPYNVNPDDDSSGNDDITIDDPYGDAPQICPEYIAESQIENSDCLRLVGDESSAQCESWDNFMLCFHSYYETQVGQCPVELIEENLYANNIAFLKFKASDQLVSCLDEVAAADDGDSPSSDDNNNNDNGGELPSDCPFYFPENIVFESGCFDRVSTFTPNCEGWDSFFECFSSYYTTSFSPCSKYESSFILIDKQRPYLELKSIESMHYCLDDFSVSEVSDASSPTDTTTTPSSQSSECSSPSVLEATLDNQCDFWSNTQQEDGCSILLQMVECSSSELTNLYSCDTASINSLLSSNGDLFAERCNCDLNQCSSSQSSDAGGSSQPQQTQDGSGTTSPSCDTTEVKLAFEEYCFESTMSSGFDQCESLMLSAFCIMESNLECTVEDYYAFFNQPQNLFYNNLQASGVCQGYYCQSNYAIINTAVALCSIPFDASTSTQCEHYDLVRQCTLSNLAKLGSQCAYVNFDSAISDYSDNYYNRFGYDGRQCI